jgi:hypothetical protein
VCSSCSPHSMPLPTLGFHTPVRVCRPCHDAHGQTVSAAIHSSPTLSAATPSPVVSSISRAAAAVPTGPYSSWFAAVADSPLHTPSAAPVVSCCCPAPVDAPFMTRSFAFGKSVSRMPRVAVTSSDQVLAHVRAQLVASHFLPGETCLLHIAPVLSYIGPTDTLMHMFPLLDALDEVLFVPDPNPPPLLVSPTEGGPSTFSALLAAGQGSFVSSRRRQPPKGVTSSKRSPGGGTHKHHTSSFSFEFTAPMLPDILTFDGLQMQFFEQYQGVGLLPSPAPPERSSSEASEPADLQDALENSTLESDAQGDLHRSSVSSIMSASTMNGEDVSVSIVESKDGAAPPILGGHGAPDSVWSQLVAGHFLFTTLGLYFAPIDTVHASPADASPALPPVCQVPWPSIRKTVNHLQASVDVGVLELFLVDGRVLTFVFRGLVSRGMYASFQDAVQFVERARIPASALQTFAVRNREQRGLIITTRLHPLVPPVPDGRDEFEPAQTLLAEWHRQRLQPNESDLTKWRISNINRDFEFCSTYPPLMMVPACISDTDLRTIGDFRSKRRIPLVSWIHPNGSAVLLRCSQPLRGIMGLRCTADENFFHATVSLLAGCTSLAIMDARPAVNAHANRISVNGGFETPAHYTATTISTAAPAVDETASVSTPGAPNMAATSPISYCALEFCNIDNIHAVSSSYKSVIDLMQQLNMHCLTPLVGSTLWSSFLDRVHRSGWLQHICLILWHASRIAMLLNQRVSVLVHCSDGWDRTSQVCCGGVMLWNRFDCVSSIHVLVVNFMGKRLFFVGGSWCLWHRS